MGTRRDYRIPVAVGATSGFAWGGAALITQKDFVRALKLCWPVLAEPRRRMLATHCNAPAQTITMTQLAKVAGYSDYTSANLHYGSTARVLTDSIGKTKSGKLRLAGIASWGDLDPDPQEPSFRFQMRPALVAAMKARTAGSKPKTARHRTAPPPRLPL